MEATGITVKTLDLSEAFGDARKLGDNDKCVKERLAEIQGYIDMSCAVAHPKPRSSIYLVIASCRFAGRATRVRG